MIQTPSLSSLSSHPAPCVWSCSHEDADWCQSWFSSKSMSLNTQMMFLIPTDATPLCCRRRNSWIFCQLLEEMFAETPSQCQCDALIHPFLWTLHFRVKTQNLIVQCGVWRPPCATVLLQLYMCITISSQTIFTFHPSKHENYRLTFLFTRTFSIFCLSYNSIKIKIATNYPVAIIVTLWQC